MHYTLKESDKEKAEGSNGAGALQQKLLESRSIVISGEINQELAQKVITQMILLQSVSNDPIKLYINSQGGHVEAGDTIHDFIKFIRPEVHVIGTGWVASAGITIFLAAKKEHRYSLPNTRFMIHQPLGGVRGQATDIEIEAREIIRMLDRVNKLIADATGQPLEKVKKRYRPQLLDVSGRSAGLRHCGQIDYPLRRAEARLSTHAVYVSGGGFALPDLHSLAFYPRLTHDKAARLALFHNRACLPSQWCYPWRIN
ncbi:ATP-dependent Clp protease proteolytic subunit [Enterobacter cancerogenus]|uniref:ATP-dependent Clp protease proteolytic subunit n=3 Tax=Enterobacteriaceae TaxID=543 RepID=A0A484ZB48_9ENTR|nr:ATP-dependent Clp protease proteolytic subunit [Enterobacter cancerogenus]